uniref:Uncharacterized protein n=1 Tax=Glossina palpalis gambiensis TaxID=67801 RepID=A0A1B0BV89_9MUSC
MNLPPSAVVPKIGALHGPEPKLFKARTVTAYLVYFRKPLRVALVVAQPLTITDFNELFTTLITGEFPSNGRRHESFTVREPTSNTSKFDGVSGRSCTASYTKAEIIQINTPIIMSPRNRNWLISFSLTIDSNRIVTT